MGQAGHMPVMPMVLRVSVVMPMAVVVPMPMVMVMVLPVFVPMDVVRIGAALPAAAIGVGMSGRGAADRRRGKAGVPRPAGFGIRVRMLRVVERGHAGPSDPGFIPRVLILI